MKTSQRLQRATFLALSIVLAIGCFSTWREVWAALDPTLYYRRDFLQEYLLARALHVGVTPYDSVRMLAERLLGVSQIPLFPHPSPHPPGVLPLLYPLGYFSYFHAQLAWLTLQSVLLLLISLLVVRQLPSLHGRSTAAVTFLLLCTICASQPGYVELVQGQFALVLAFLAVGSLLALQANRVILAGVCLGAALAVKFYGAPIVLILLLRRSYRIVAATVVSFCVCNALAFFVAGSETFATYYLEVLPKISHFYLHDTSNLSLMSLPAKLTQGTRQGVLYAVNPTGLLPDLEWIRYSLYLLMTLLGLYTLWFANRLPMREAWLYLFCMQLVFSPITWIHGYTVALVLLPWMWQLSSGWARAVVLGVFVLIVGGELLDALLRTSSVLYAYRFVLLSGLLVLALQCFASSVSEAD